MSEPEAIPSIACLNDDGKMLTGYTARKYIQLDDPSARTFSAFKMLLTESNEKLLRERGFGTDYTPSAVAETFLRDQVNKILSSHADPGVDNLVICAPEVWTTQSAVRRGQLDGRTILRDICSRIPGVDCDRIRIVSEPAAASAYFAYQYRRAVGSNFNGCLLIVDYGGGTLDLTLTEVHPQDASVEIKVLFRTGAGENVQGRTGNAGIAYMEHAVHLALEEGGAPALPPRIPEGGGCSGGQAHGADLSEYPRSGRKRGRGLSEAVGYRGRVRCGPVRPAEQRRDVCRHTIWGKKISCHLCASHARVQSRGGA